MIRTCLVVVTSLGVMLAHEAQSEACGVKLTVKAKAPKIAKSGGSSNRSQNPSQILLLGNPPRALANDLQEQGHSVEVARNPDAARRARYHMVVADADQVGDARQRWPGVLVVERKGSGTANEVETRLARAPRRKLVTRVAVKGKEERAPIAAGPETGQRAPIAGDRGEVTPAETGGGEAGGAISSGGDETAPTRTTAARDNQPKVRDKRTKPTRVATTTESKKVPDTDDSADIDDTDDQPKAPAERPAKFSKYVFFGNGSTSITGRFQRKLNQTARWMEQNPDKSITVEGHANTTGNADVNMQISESRAEAVKDYLVEQGVDSSRISTQGFGMERPEFQPGSSGKNRRVVIVVD